MNAIKSFKSLSKKEKMIRVGMLLAVIALAVICAMNMPLASGNATGQIKNVLNSMIEIVGIVFQAVGVILSVYSVGQLVLAFKNEDADSKSRASTMLVVGVCLIAIPQLVKSLNLVNMIGG